MRFLDDKGRIFGAVSVVDIFAVLLLVIFAYTGAVRFLGWGTARYDTGDIEFSAVAEITDVRQATVDAINEGDVVRDHITGHIIGSIVDKQVRPYRTPVETADGDVIIAEVPERYTILVTVEGLGYDTGDVIQVASHQLRIGASLMLETRTYSVHSTVLQIEAGISQ